MLAAVGRRPFLHLVGDPDRPETWLKPSDAGPQHFDVVDQFTKFGFKPFYDVGDEEAYNLHFSISSGHPLGAGLRATSEGLEFAWPPLAG